MLVRVVPFEKIIDKPSTHKAMRRRRFE